MHPIERELGQIHEALRSLSAGQDRLEEIMRDFVRDTKQSLNEHEDKDDGRFDKLADGLHRVHNKLAYYAGGIAVFTGLLEYLKK